MPETVRFEQIGQVLKSNGTDGQVIIGLRGLCAEDISEKEPVFIFFDGLPVPFFLSGIVERGSAKILAHLTDINNIEDAAEIEGKAVYLPDDAFEDEEAFQDFTGWRLLAEDGTEIGNVTGLEDIPGNPCLEVRTEKGTVLVPLHEDLVVNIDEQGRILSMRIPDGLLQC